MAFSLSHSARDTPVVRTPRLFSVLLALAACAILSTPARGQLPALVPATADEILSGVREGGATLTVVNVWATWCVPCREEFPAFVKLGKDFDARGVDVVFVSADFADDIAAARRFLAEHGVEEPSYLKQGKDDAFVKTLHEGWSGALPATVVFGPQGRRLDFWEGKTTYDALVGRVERLLQ